MGGSGALWRFATVTLAASATLGCGASNSSDAGDMARGGAAGEPVGGTSGQTNAGRSSGGAGTGGEAGSATSPGGTSGSGAGGADGVSHVDFLRVAGANFYDPSTSYDYEGVTAHYESERDVIRIHGERTRDNAAWGVTLEVPVTPMSGVACDDKTLVEVTQQDLNAAGASAITKSTHAAGDRGTCTLDLPAVGSVGEIVVGNFTGIVFNTASPQSGGSSVSGSFSVTRGADE